MKKRPSEGGGKHSVLCVMTDRLHLGYLGAYGSDNAETESWDRFSFESTLFDQFYADTLDPALLCCSFWRGVSPFQSESSAENSSLPILYRQAGYRTILITDRPVIAEHPLAKDFDRIEFLEFPAPESPAETEEETQIFSAFAQVADILLEVNAEDSPFFIWADLSGMGGAWDFPQETRECFIEDEEDPPPYERVTPPSFELRPNPPQGRESQDGGDSEEEEPDFDLLQSVVETYKAGISIWDRSLGDLLAILEETGLLEETLLVLGSGRGFPMGEHSRVGFASDPSEETPLFHAEELHLPLLIHFPNGFGASVRSGGICGPSDLCQTLAASLNFNFNNEDSQETSSSTLISLASEESEAIRSHLAMTAFGAESRVRGILTDEWFLILRAGGDGKTTTELYVRPDDRWDVNEVTNRCEGTVEELKNILDLEFQSAKEPFEEKSSTF